MKANEARERYAEPIDEAIGRGIYSHMNGMGMHVARNILAELCAIVHEEAYQEGRASATGEGASARSSQPSIASGRQDALKDTEREEVSP